MTNAIQNISVIGKVYYLKINEVEQTKNGKHIQKVHFGLRMNNNTSVFAEATLWNMDRPANFTQQKYYEYVKMSEIFESGEDLYASARAFPSKDGSMFDKLSMYEKRDGKIGMSLQASVNFVDNYTRGDNEVILKHKTRDGGYEQAWSDAHSKFVFQMVVEEKEGQLLCLTDGKDYATKIYGALPDGVPNKAKVGQGYKFQGELKKGAKISVKVSDNIWEDEASEEVEYADDTFVLTPMGVVKGLSLDIIERPEQQEIVRIENLTPVMTKIATDDNLPF